MDGKVFFGTVLPLESLEFENMHVFLFDLAADQELEPLLVPGRMEVGWGGVGWGVPAGFPPAPRTCVSGSRVFPFRFLFFEDFTANSPRLPPTHRSRATVPTRKRLHL